MSRKTVSYRWHLRRVMAERGMFATTDLGPLLADARGDAVPRAGLPAGQGRARTAEPDRPGRAVRHPGLRSRRPDRASAQAGPQAGAAADPQQRPRPVRARVIPGPGAR